MQALKNVYLKVKGKFYSFRQQDTTFDNPTYDATPFTPTQYSSHGPDDIRSPPTTTSASHPATSTTATAETSVTPPTYATVNKKTSKKRREQTHNIGSENGIGREYGVLEDTGEGKEGGDVVYQVLEGSGVATYEAPVPVKVSPAANQATNTQDEEYSTLKYN